MILRLPRQKFLLSSLLSVAALGMLALSIGTPSPAFAQKSKALSTNDYKVNVVTLVEGLRNPWGLAFLPDGRMLVTERRGTLRVIDGGKFAAGDSIEVMPE